MSRSIKKRWTLFGVAMGAGATLALVVGLGVLAGAGAAASQANPSNTSEPQISGTAVQGQTLTTTTGSWSNDPTSFAFQWLRCPQSGGQGDGSDCGLIAGATTNTYTLTSDDVGFTIRARVTATNTDGSASAASNPTAVVTAAAFLPQNTSPPTITGTPQQGQTLTGDRGNWSGNPTDYSYIWTRCDNNGGNCSNISSANNTTYTLTSNEVGHTVRFNVTAMNTAGSTTATSVPTAVIVTAAAFLPQNTSPPTITGTPQEGQMLTGQRGTWSGNPTGYIYFWMRCDKNGGNCADIGGAHALTYRLTSAGVGNTIRFRVEAKNVAGSNTATSVPTAVITAAAKPPPPPPATGCPSGSGPVQAANVSSPARLLIDVQGASPGVVHRGTQQLIVRYHVSACGGRSVQGALVYATAVPFNQLTIPPEQVTGPNGWASLDFRMLAGFPVSPKQQLIAIFARARKSGENLLTGISSRRLFSVRVNLHG